MSKYTPEEQRLNRRSWVNALRSEEYRQVESKLSETVVDEEGNEREPGYCCLGVACDISGIAEWKDGFSFRSYDNECSGLPQSVQDWLGLTTCSGSFFNSEDDFLTGQNEHSLIELNDEENYDFDQIADVIEAEPHGLLQEHHDS